jgi:hypothetical protein
MKGTEWRGKKENILCVLDVAGNTYSRGWGGGERGVLPPPPHLSLFLPWGSDIFACRDFHTQDETRQKERAQNLPSAL